MHEEESHALSTPRIPRCAGISTTMPRMQHGGGGGGRRELSDSTAEVLLLLNNLGDPRRIIIVRGEGEEDRRNTAGGKCWPPGTGLSICGRCRRRRSCCLLSGNTENEIPRYFRDIAIAIGLRGEGNLNRFRRYEHGDTWNESQR